MDLDLQGRHALVGGASQGIGRASAVELARLGAAVTVLGRDPGRLAATLAELRGIRPDGAFHALAVDYADRSSLRATLEAHLRAHPAQILVNNAGGPPPGALVEATEQAFLATFGEHLLVNHLLLQACLPGMRAAGYGRVVNVISTSVKEPIRGLGVSNTIRGAVASWAKTLAAELGPAGITVNNVLPGFTRTARLDGLIRGRMQASGADAASVEAEMLRTVPLARFAEAAEVAAVIAFLASPAAAYVSGINVPVDGGRTLSM